MGKKFFGCLGNGCEVPRMAITLIVSQGLYAAMVLQISQEDEIEVTRVFISENVE